MADVPNSDTRHERRARRRSSVRRRWVAVALVTLAVVAKLRAVISGNISPKYDR
jgi:hypothetical protein